MLHWAAGNQDPAVHENPHKFDLRRAQKPLTTFGAGAQICPGRNLVRALAAEAVKRLAASGLRPGIAGPVKWLDGRVTISQQYPEIVPAVLKAA